MKIILLADVKKIGRRGEIKEVPDGYAQNFIFPRKLGEPATKEKITKIESEKKGKESERELRKELLLRELSKLANLEYHVYRKVNSSGSLFGSITEKEIQETIQATSHIHIPLEHIILLEQIKHTGTYQITIGNKKILGASFYVNLVVHGQ